MTDTTPDLEGVTLGTQSDHVSTEEIATARTSLTRWVDQVAAVTACTAGFGWVTTEDAPTTYPDLCAAYVHSQRTGEPLPVSSKNSASVILTSPGANFAWRFVHDTSHVHKKLSFSLRDEYELALCHLEELKRDGFSPDSLEYAFLKADTLGQVIINAVARRFPGDQELFDLECQRFGFEQGILREIRRESS
ncbi:MAG: hypothetical protein CME34_19500 [Gordonia sp.]|uniref:hypothetical protein n=1 Tax=Gordonia sp. (in: high G+C Gram-positive bacteria) TaxID=84139 RepID=UPI000C6026CF|nr:hypothetical protein [Gordonia sp. (in: high G+C Gram-positive bacteria)]MAU84010.1 hypothetical protein [Gordonia sp. (in: high G+C Gram-positive bacteria)]